eukprot:RCo038540
MSKAEAGDGPPAPPPVNTVVRACFTFVGKHPEQLSFQKGELVTVVSAQNRNGWWHGTLQGRTGFFPHNYVVVHNEEPEKLKKQVPKQIDAPQPVPDSAAEEKKTDEPRKIEEEPVPHNEGPGESISAESVRNPSKVEPSKQDGPVVGQRRLALFDFAATDKLQISFKVGQVLTVVSTADRNGWWEGVVGDPPAKGFFPVVYTKEEPESFAEPEAGSSVKPDTREQNDDRRKGDRRSPVEGRRDRESSRNRARDDRGSDRD